MGISLPYPPRHAHNGPVIDVPWLADERAWQAEIIEWVATHVPVDRAEPHKLREWGATLRVTTGGSTLWCKAVGPERAFEPVLTAALPPGLGPDVLAVDAERRWLLLADHGAAIADSLRLAEQLDVIDALLPRYAEAQRALAASTSTWLDAGIPDRRVSVLPEVFATFLAGSPHLDTCAPALPRLEAACAELAATPVPDAVDHADLHGTNVLTGGRLIDWGDACTTHPFCTLSVTFDLVVGAPSDRLRAAYLEPWGGETADNLRAFELATWVAPVVRVLSLAEVSDGAGEIADLLAVWVGNAP